MWQLGLEGERFLVEEPEKLALLSGDSAAVLIGLLVLWKQSDESRSFQTAVMLRSALKDGQILLLLSSN